MIKKIYLKLTLLQCVSLIFLIIGVKKLNISNQANLYDAIVKENWEKLQSITSKNIGDSLADLLIHQAYCVFGSFIIFVVIIGLINGKNKIPVINSILIFGIVFTTLLISKFFNGEIIINKFMNYLSLSGLLPVNYKTNFFISGIILLLFGLIILWLSIKLIKKHYTQHGV